MFNENYTVIIPAGGTGDRLKSYLQGQSKQFVKINDTPILEIVINKFFNFIPIRELVVSLPELQYAENYEYYSEKFPTIKIVKGGDSRQESVHKALKSLKFKTGKVIIHDAVRPFFTKHELMMVIEKAEEKGSAILAVKSKDTVRIAQDGLSRGIVNRDQVWLVQTPQIFDLELLNDVYAKAEEEEFIGTDDATLLEYYGHEIYIVEGEYHNFKITNSFDFKIAQYLSGLDDLGELL